MLEIRKYENQTGRQFEAAKFDGDNAEEVANWCGGEIKEVNGVLYIELPTFHVGRMHVFKDYWVIKTLIGEFYSYPSLAFARAYKECRTVVA